MPLINGMKMACEPCIRGHRSTKCTHAAERLMVPVRKPGRPLSSCPHPASRSCSCAAVTAAIPRKQKCSCGTSDAPAAELIPEQDTPGPESTPSSPSKASTYRVQKPPSKRPSSRKQSISVSGLEKMDSSQLNIMSSYDGMQQKAAPMMNGHMAPMTSLPPYGALGMATADGAFHPQPMIYPMFQPTVSAPPMGPQVSKSMTNGHAVSTNGSTEPETASPGGCCGGKSAVNTSTPEQTPTPVTVSNGTTEKAATKSCCAPTAESPEIKAQPELMPAPQMPPQANGVVMSPFQTPIAMPNGMYSYFPQPTVFTYPPQYGSYLQPLQPEQWRQVMTALSFGQPIPPNAFGMPGPMAFPPPATPSTDAGTSHQCSCGNSCQCVGCAAHPYNEATQSYVRSAWKTMTEDAQSARIHTNGSHTHTKVGGGHETTINGTPTSNGTTTPTANPTEEMLSPTAPQTPSDAASGTTEEETLSANDFFFVSYPFGDACAGETSSCPCGDDCQCIGCAIHNTPDTVETAA